MTKINFHLANLKVCRVLRSLKQYIKNLLKVLFSYLYKLHTEVPWGSYLKKKSQQWRIKNAKQKQVLSFWHYVNFPAPCLVNPSRGCFFQHCLWFPCVLRANSTDRWGAKPHPWLLMKYQSVSTELPYLLTSQILLVASMEAEATKSPQECQEQPRTAREWPRRVRMQPRRERSQILTVVSPLDVTSWVPLQEE